MRRCACAASICATSVLIVALRLVELLRRRRLLREQALACARRSAARSSRCASSTPSWLPTSSTRDAARRALRVDLLQLEHERATYRRPRRRPRRRGVGPPAGVNASSWPPPARRRRPPSLRRCRTRRACGLPARRRATSTRRASQARDDRAFSSWNLHAERGERFARACASWTRCWMRASRAESRSVLRSTYSAAVTTPSRSFARVSRVDALAQRDDPIVERENAVEPRDRRERLLNAAVQRLRERRFVRRHDLALDLERPRARDRRAPVPRRPLHLHAGEPVRLESSCSARRAGPPIADASERRDPRLLLRGLDRLLLRESLARRAELLVLRARAQLVQRRDARARPAAARSGRRASALSEIARPASSESRASAAARSRASLIAGPVAAAAAWRRSTPCRRAARRLRATGSPSRAAARRDPRSPRRSRRSAARATAAVKNASFTSWRRPNNGDAHARACVSASCARSTARRGASVGSKSDCCASRCAS